MDFSIEHHGQAVALLHRYCWSVDHHHESALTEVLGENAALVVRPSPAAEPATVSGRDAVVDALASLFPRRSWARHFVSNELVESSPDGSLILSCYFRFVLAEWDGRIEGLGDYEAHLTEEGGRLVISRLAVTILERAVSPVTSPPPQA